MNLDRIIDMVIRRVVGRLINTGVNKGFDVAGQQMGRFTKKSAPEPEHQRAEAGPDDLQAFGLFDGEEPTGKQGKRSGQ